MKECEALAAAATVLLPVPPDRGTNVNEGMAVGGAKGSKNVVQSEGGSLPTKVNRNH